MRRQKIMSLHRAHIRPPGYPVFVRFNTDGERDIRRLADIDTILPLGEVQEKHGILEPRGFDFTGLAPDELVVFIRSIGVKIEWLDDGPNCEFFNLPNLTMKTLGKTRV